jgi:portal protein
MATDSDDDKTVATDDEKSVAAAVKWLNWVASVEADQRKDEEECLEFQDAEGNGGWPSDARAARAGGMVNGVDTLARPVIGVATLDEPISLVQSFERQAKLSPRIHPLTEDASDDTAEVMQGIYRCIERDSRAELARRWAYDRTLWAGRGAWRVDCVYDPEGGHPLDQKIIIKRLLYQANAFFDPYAQEPDWSDGLRAMVVQDLPWSVYKRKYKNSKLAQADREALNSLAIDAMTESWVRVAGDGTGEERSIRVAEDWRVEITEVDQVLLDDNSVADADKIPKGRKKHPTDKRAVPKREERRVFWRVINAIEELEPEQEWDGRYIPLIPAVGRELQPMKGKRRWFGMVHNAKGSVRLTNVAASGAIEMAALEPKAPWMAEEGTIENYKKYYELSATRNIAVLPWRGRNLDGERAEKPSRVQVDVSRLGPSMELLKMGREFVQAATATHPPALGQDSPAFRSGRAINALQSQSVQSNSPFLDNLADISLAYEARVILDLMPKKYDRPGRVARSLGLDGTSELVMLNHPYQPGINKRPVPMPYDTPEQQQATNAAVANPQHPAKHYDLTKGAYGVEVSIGKSYLDERQEGMSEMGAILQSDPQMMMIVGPEYFKYRGEVWSDHVAGLLDKQRRHAMPWLYDDQQQPNAQQLQAENQQLKQALGQAAQEKAGKVIEQQGRAQVAMIQESAETQRAREANETKLAVAAIGAKIETLTNMMQIFMDERSRLGSQAHEAGMAAQQNAHDAAMAQGDHQAALVQGDQAHQQALAQGQQDAAIQAQQQAAQPSGQNGQQ